MSGRVLVTGGLGFIGSAFVRALAADGVAVLNVDADTYAGDDRRLAGVAAGAGRDRADGRRGARARRAGAA